VCRHGGERALRLPRVCEHARHAGCIRGIGDIEECDGSHAAHLLITVRARIPQWRWAGARRAGKRGGAMPGLRIAIPVTYPLPIVQRQPIDGSNESHWGVAEREWLASDGGLSWPRCACTLSNMSVQRLEDGVEHVSQVVLLALFPRSPAQKLTVHAPARSAGTRLMQLPSRNKRAVPRSSCKSGSVSKTNAAELGSMSTA
jgi:hypothetical protein